MKRLRTRPEYQAVARGARVSRPSFLLQAAVRETEGGPPRFGFTVTKKTGNAVVRNRIRRRLKEAARQKSGLAFEGVDYVLVGRRTALARGFQSILADVEGGLAQAGSRQKLMKRADKATERSDGK